MYYSVEWSEKSNRQLKSLDKGLARRIVRKVKELEAFPFEKSKPLSGCDFRRLRVGDFRIIVEICKGRKLVKIIMLGKREKIYKMLGQKNGRS